MLHATSLYAALAGAMLIYLGLKVIGVRRRANVSVGDGGDESLLRAMRAQGNFCEYVPLALILMGTLEVNGGPGWMIHVIGIVLMAGRVLHAVGVGPPRGVMKARVWGMYLTGAAICAGIGLNLLTFASAYL